MEFNYCVGNPAFNISEENNIAGTGGNTTLYKTATRHDFANRLANNGTLVNITLKGIIPDLLNGHFKKYQVNWIHLMDNFDVWPYNTCIFSVSKAPRTSAPIILGGMGAKIYSPNPNDCFPFVYYSGSNNGMNKQFGHTCKNKVIRQLPGKGRDEVKYDYTDKDILTGPKFAFSVLESKKSYIVTSEPICGGTICYVPLDTEAQAEKLKLFVEKNQFFAEYVKRMKVRGHAFALRHMKRFDLSQIVSGEELPVEWNLSTEDLLPPIKISNDTTENKTRVKELGEVFTPTELVTFTLGLIAKFDPTAFTDPTTTFVDSMAGNGQFLVGIVNAKLANGSSSDDALSTVHGIDLTQLNIDTCRERLSALGNVPDGTLHCADSLGEVLTNKADLPALFVPAV